ncbi:PPE domain-containing protein [Lentzea nigeriaca]|uniref:PPE domain-containing protein n=1 Tax=Lentzea nigeriaca TaxID=1128665 RepID=UPI00195EA5B1|nr:PPE domain-containing protein [Lentzea nigeriaca]MBM7862788.1 hypothetical protein [Lentzea nigeriaca]
MNEVIGYYRYEGYPLEQKIAWIRQGTGPSALTGAQDALRSLSVALIESEQRLHDIVTKLGGAWSGAAADAAGAAMKQTATWSGETGELTGDAWTSVELQAEQVERARSLTPGSAPAAEYGFDDALADSFNATSGGLFDVQTNFDEQAARRKAIDEEVNRILYAHEAASRTNLAAVPALAEVPRVTADSVPPATDCLPVGPVQTTDQQPPDIAKTGDQRRSGEHDQKQDKDDDKKTKQDKEENDKPGQVEPQPDRERTTTSAVTTPEARQAVQEQQGQQQNNTRASSVHNGLPTPVGGAGTPVTERPGVLPRTTPGTVSTGWANGTGPGRTGAGTTSRTGGGTTSRTGGGTTSRTGVGGLGSSAITGKGRDQAVAPGNRTGVHTASPQSSARGGLSGQSRAGQALGGGYGPHAAAHRDEDAEHTDRYYQGDDGIFGLDDLSGVAPAVLGEEAE